MARGLASAWLCVSIALSIPWLHELAATFAIAGPLRWVLAIFVIGGIAWVPGYLMTFLCASILRNHPVDVTEHHPSTAVTLVIAARNEADAIARTIRSLAATVYDGPLRVILADNGSTDGTAEIALATAAATGMQLEVVTETRPGKAAALNRALERVCDPVIATLDADTVLEPDALRRLVARLERPDDRPAAVAGHVLVANPTASLWTRIQAWDYRLAITAIKEFQGAYDSTLVAQGAFSAYDTAAVRSAGGWSETVGEDIVLTWHLLEERRPVVFEGTAIAYTTVPVKLGAFFRQRRRWGRGMVEAIREVPPRHLPSHRARSVAELDLVIPWMDFAYTLAWIPGLVLACFGNYAIAGPWTLLVIPWTLLLLGFVQQHQRSLLRPVGLDLHLDWSAIAYIGLFQLVQSPAAVAGYILEFTQRTKRW